MRKQLIRRNHQPEEEVLLLKQMATDLKFLKVKVTVMQKQIEEMSNNDCEVREEYINKIKNIDEKGNFHSFDSVDTLRKSIEVE